jgi:hypothetical protein
MSCQGAAKEKSRVTRSVLIAGEWEDDLGGGLQNLFRSTAARLTPASITIAGFAVPLSVVKTFP